MSSDSESLSRDMSLFDITMIGVGAMIGAGIFVLTGKASGVAGPALILAFSLNGIVALLTAMVYAELGSAIPEAGGGYLWIKEGLPGANAFLAGWMSWFAHAVAGALYALGFGAFVAELLHIMGMPVMELAQFLGQFKPLIAWTGLDVTNIDMVKKLFGLIIAGLFAYINFRGASETGLAGNIVTVLKVVVILIFIAFGLKFMFYPEFLFTAGEADPSLGGQGTKQLHPFITDSTGWIGILSAMGFTFIAFEGYEIIVQAGEEVEDPEENIPKAVFWSLTVVIPIYILVAFVLIGGTFSSMLFGSVPVGNYQKVVEGEEGHRSQRLDRRAKALKMLGLTTYKKLQEGDGSESEHDTGSDEGPHNSARGSKATDIQQLKEKTASELQKFNELSYSEAPAAIQNTFSKEEWSSIKIRNFELLEHIGELGLANASRQFVPFGAILILLGGLLSTMSALNATTFSSTRVSFAMGRDKNLPDQFADIHPRTRTPHMALFWTAILIGSMVLFVPLETVAGAADIMFLLLFFQVCIASITLRKKYGDKLAYGYLMPFFPVLPVLAMIGMIFLAVFMYFEFKESLLISVAWIVVGYFIYRFYAEAREREEEAPPILVEEKPLEVKPKSVLIPVANPEAAREHIRLGAKIAEHEDSELILLHVVSVPAQLPPSAAKEFADEARPTIDQASDYAEEVCDVPVRTMIRVGHKPAKAIIHTALDQNTEYLVMGWKGKVHKEETVIGSNIDKVLVESNVHSIVMQRNIKRPKKILVPIADPSQSPLALGVAGLMVDDERDANITALHLSPEPLSEEEKEQFREKLGTFARESEEGPQSLFTEDSPVSLEFDQSSDIVEDLSRRTANYDNVILGTSHGGLTGRKVFGRIPTEIAAESSCPVMFVRMKEGGVKYEVQQFFHFFRKLEEMGEPDPSRSPELESEEMDGGTSGAGEPQSEEPE